MKNRMARYSSQKRQPADIDITSLLDILTIILVFLLYSYNPSDLSLDLVDKLQLADSFSKDITSVAPVVQINSDLKVFFNSKDIGSIHDTQTLFTLRSLLEEDKKSAESKAALKSTKTSDPLVNLVFDKNTESKYVNKLMHESATVGYSKFKFIVRTK